MVQTFKSLPVSLEGVELYEKQLAEQGYIFFRSGENYKYGDLIGVQAFSLGCYLGKTLFVTVEKAYYDKEGYSHLYRCRRYVKPSKTSAYNKYKYSRFGGY